uniref:(northern house mosquito) hypothetical protein n=1 Tax=Culex pipiens TaxID=7175 RepID=A0A8D8LC64_CULPI
MGRLAGVHGAVHCGQVLLLGPLRQQKSLGFTVSRLEVGSFRQMSFQILGFIGTFELGLDFEELAVRSIQTFQTDRNLARVRLSVELRDELFHLVAHGLDTLPPDQAIGQPLLRRSHNAHSHSPLDFATTKDKTRETETARSIGYGFSRRARTELRDAGSTGADTTDAIVPP